MLHHPHPLHENNLKAIIYLLLVLLAFGIFILFYNNSELILQSHSFTLFMVLVTVGMTLMVGLVYLVSNSKHPSHHKVAHHKEVSYKSKVVSSKKGSAKKKKK
jgi:hypothetical protein